MLNLQLDANPNRPMTALCLGAHCDDIEIGCGASLLQLAANYPQLQFHWCIFTSDPQRAAESQRAAHALLGADRVQVDILDYPASFLPARWEAVKQSMEHLRSRMEPDLIFTHRLEDRHQDHRVVAELTWNSFRNHRVLEYEIAKYEGDLGQPNLIIPVDAAHADRKIAVLMEHYPSQHARNWFDAETFRALMRLRGLECQSPSRYAEGFTARKLTLA